MADKEKDRGPEIYATGNPEPIDKPKELPPEIDAERQAIAQELNDYIAAHPTERELNYNSTRPLLDASHVLAFLSSFTEESVKMTENRHPGDPFPLHYKGAAHVLTELFTPYCNGPDLADVVADCVKKYLATYPQPDTGQQDKENQNQFADANTTPTIGDINRAESALMDAQTAAAAADISDLAQSALDAIPNIDELNQAADTLENAVEQITAHRVDHLDNPIDKVNNSVWNLLKENTHGQETFDIKANPDGKPDVNFTYSIDFDVIESNQPVVKRLTQYDKRVYIAAGALYNAGNSVFTTTQIYHAMGYTKRPNSRDLEKIDKSLTKFGARIYLDNRQEIEAGYKYPLYQYDGDLMPFERVREKKEINGKLTESTIHVFREPPLLHFARDRKQITTVPIKLLQGPFNKTELNLSLEDYLIERIARARDTGKKQETIKFSTLFEHLHLDAQKDRQQRNNVRTRAAEYLDYFKECKYISNYEPNKEKIVVKL